MGGSTVYKFHFGHYSISYSMAQKIVQIGV